LRELAFDRLLMLRRPVNRELEHNGKVPLQRIPRLGF